jgi:hypothetical protein
MTRKYSTWTMLRELQKDPSLIFESTQDTDLRPMRCHSDMRGHVSIRWMKLIGNEKPELDFIPQRHDWVIVNRPKRERYFLGEAIGGKHGVRVGGFYFAPPAGKTWDVYAFARNTEDQ